MRAGKQLPLLGPSETAWVRSSLLRPVPGGISAGVTFGAKFRYHVFTYSHYLPVPPNELRDYVARSRHIILVELSRTLQAAMLFGI